MVVLIPTPKILDIFFLLPLFMSSVNWINDTLTEEEALNMDDEEKDTSKI